MALFTDEERKWAEALVGLGYCNPFLPERIAYERVILGDAFVGAEEVWHKQVEEEGARPNLELLTHRAKELADKGRSQLFAGRLFGEREMKLYEDTVLYYLFNKYSEQFYTCAITVSAPGKTTVVDFYDLFCEDVRWYLDMPGGMFLQGELSHIFACFYQVRRAWHNIYENIIGGSMASVKLRAAVWQSIFTCDIGRYRRALFQRMGDITTLVAGPSGTGKELVARAIGLSRYIPFDPRRRVFSRTAHECFHPINISALPPTIIESELFGHKKGSFTGAVADRVGFLELCPIEGTVFLDEIGEIDPAIQVKLLRVLETRAFQRLGESGSRPFQGKVIAATNRNLQQEMEAGRFRRDLYYRLCSDIITTPSLKEQMEGTTGQLRYNLLLFLSRRIAGMEEADALAREVESWIDKHIDPGYDWPGNVRELEQCVRNVMIRQSYQPVSAAPAGAREQFLKSVREGSLGAEEMLNRYCTLVYAETGSYLETARRLGLDRRTVKERIDQRFLQEIGEPARGLR